jgi:parallel beta-helix repeat protein
VVADGVALLRITVTVRDKKGNRLAGEPVQVLASGSKNDLEQVVKTTLGDGRVFATLTSTKAEPKEISAIVGTGASAVTLAAHPVATFIGDAANLSASLSKVTGTPEALVADGTSMSIVRVVVRDINSNAVPDLTVELAATGTQNLLGQPAGPTDANGVTHGTLASTKAELKTVSATVHGPAGDVALDDHPLVEFVGDLDDVSALLSSVTAAPDSDIVADGVAVSTITVVARDIHSNAVEGAIVELAATGTGNTLVQPPGPTDATGTAVGTLASIVAESKTVTATVNPGASEVILVEQPVVTFVSLVSSSQSSVTATPAFGALADGNAIVTLKAVVRNDAGAPVPGRTVEFDVTGLSNTVTQPGTVTDADGIATGTLQSTVAESKTITATVDPGIGEVVLDDHPVATLVWAVPDQRYVRKTGSDAKDGASPATAWRTIGKAASAVAPGETVNVGAGIYQESVTLTTDGTLGSPIVFRADVSGDRTGDAGAVVIDGQGAAQAIALDGADHVTLEGFTVIGASSGAAVGIRVGSNATTAVTLRSNTVYSNGEGIHASDASELVIEGNRVSRQVLSGAATGHGIVIDSCDLASITGNLVYANEGYGVLVTGSSVDPLIEANTLYANTDDQIHVDGLLNIVTMRNNVVSEGMADGIEVEVLSVGLSSYNISWGNQGLDWNGLTMGPGDQSADPLLVDPPGADHLLGGADGDDDRFELDLASPGNDAGSADAAAIALADGSTLADRTTRIDGVLDGSPPDGALANLGFHYAAPLGELSALASGDARLLHGKASERQARLRTHDATLDAWSVPELAPSTGASLRWTLHALSPLASPEELSLVLWDDGSTTELSALRWSGAAWHEDWTASGIPSANAHARGFDLATFSTGEALAVFSNGTANPRYRYWSGGTWSDEADVFAVAPGVATVLWVELAPDVHTLAATLVYSDADSDLHTIAWDGAAWDAANAAVLETDLRTVATRSFDVEYESQSADVLAIWAGPSDLVGWATRASGSAVWNVQAGIAGLDETPAVFDLAADPSSDRIAMAGMEDALAGSEPKVATWNGAAWADAAKLEIGAGVSSGASQGDLGVAAGWVGSGGTAIAVYSDDLAGALDWGRWTAGTGWSLEPAFAIAGKGTTESVLLVGLPGTNALWAVLSDSNADLWAASSDGSSWSLSNGGAALETDLSSIDGVPFDLRVRAP